MYQEFVIAYPGVLCPIKMPVETYKSLVKAIIKNQYLDDAIFYYFIKKGVFLVENDCLRISKGYYATIYNEFVKLPELIQSKFLLNFSNELKKIFSTSIYYDLIFTYLSLLDNTLNSKNEINKQLDKQINTVLSDSSIDLQNFIEISNIFTSNFVSDKIKSEIVNIFYKYNQNRVVANIYQSISNKDVLNAETLIKISSSYFMLSENDKANAILDVIKNKFDDQNIILAVKIIELINRYESNIDVLEIKELKNEYYKLVSEIELNPNCANLLLKISSSILPHEEAICLMINSNLSNHILQVFNNLGAIYLTEGAKKCLIDPKDKEYIIKAEKYLSFAKTYGEERGEYSPYLSLNLLTLRFYKEYKKKSLTKQYKTIYNNFKKLYNKADSLYFKSIILCNCFILEKLTTQSRDSIQSYYNKLNSVLQTTCDSKVKEKIEKFLNFSPQNDKFIPIWIITETHY